MNDNIEKKFPQRRLYPDLSPVRVACLFVVKALNKLVEEMSNQVYFEFDVNGLILRATDKDSLGKASNKLDHWRDQTSIGILTDNVAKEDYKKFIDSDLQVLLRQERAFINVISYDKFLQACDFLNQKGFKGPKEKYDEIQAENPSFSLLMCTKHRFKEIKERIEVMLEPFRKVKRKKKQPLLLIQNSMQMTQTWDDADSIAEQFSENELRKTASSNLGIEKQEEVISEVAANEASIQSNPDIILWLNYYFLSHRKESGKELSDQDFNINAFDALNIPLTCNNLKEKDRHRLLGLVHGFLAPMRRSQDRDEQLFKQDQLTNTLDYSILKGNKGGQFVEYEQKEYYLKRLNSLIWQVPQILVVHERVKLMQGIIDPIRIVHFPETSSVKYGLLIPKKQRSLKDVIKEGELFSFYQQLKAAQSIISILNQIHTNDIPSYHGNLKLTNIMFDQSDRISLSGLGYDVKQNKFGFFDSCGHYAKAIKKRKSKLFIEFSKFLDFENFDEQQSKEMYENNEDKSESMKVGKQSFKKEYKLTEKLQFNQLADIQAIGCVLLAIFSSKEMSAQSYFTSQNQRKLVKRMSQESPSAILAKVFSLIFSILEFKVLTIAEIQVSIEEILSSF